MLVIGMAFVFGGDYDEHNSGSILYCHMEVTVNSVV